MKYLAVCLLLSLSGCSGESAAPPPRPVVAPDRIHVAGIGWTKQPALTLAGEQLLSHYFRRNPSIAENPLVKGQPTPYVCEQKTRFYWLSATPEQVNWFFLEFDRDRFVTTGEGAGEPFTTAD